MATPPALPKPPKAYEERFFGRLLAQLRLYFSQLYEAEGRATHVDLTTLPTEAEAPDLAPGAIYRDTTAGNVIKVKT